MHIMKDCNSQISIILFTMHIISERVKRARHYPGVTQLKIGDVCWRASEASETVLGVDNAKSGICSMYVYM